MDARHEKLRYDPRLYQITVLSSLLLYGVLALDFEVHPVQAAAILTTALLCQRLFTSLCRLPSFDPRSPLISGLSLCLLLRTHHLALAVLAAAITIAGKFLIRWRGKHVFNPTNFGLVVMLLVSDAVWVSPGQWGSAALLGFLLAGLGGLVVHRAERADVTWAFLGAYSLLLFGRAAWLGDPWSIPLHQLQSGAFLVFAFFMISDPKTTPDTRAGRVVYATLVAAVALFIQFGLYQPSALLWALVGCAPLVPVLDRLLPGERYRWHGETRAVDLTSKENLMSRNRMKPALLASFLLLFTLPASSRAFCGFYVAKADTELFNQASKVVLVRDGDRTVITMANDYRGEPEEFAMVVPVPTFLEREQIHVSDRAVLEHLDAYSAPRLVEYHDSNPCHLYRMRSELRKSLEAVGYVDEAARQDAAGLGVTIEASYSVGEYEILILSADESRGLETWLRSNGYRIPEGASEVLRSYLRQGMRFFVAKVDLEEQSRLGYSYLRPLQIAFESRKFMLPIRLGTINADGPQELFVFVLNRTGRVETTNYRTVRLPSDLEVPVFVKDEFADFYREMFARQVERERMRTVFLEYAWDMGWCDPCAADPLSEQELRELGVFWLADRPDRPVKAQARDVFITRLHLRYTGSTFPEDLMFQETGDRGNFQGRYVIRHPWQGSGKECPQAASYLEDLRRRQDREAETLASLTGWDVADIRRKMDLGIPVEASDDTPWWKKLWSGSQGR